MVTILPDAMSTLRGHVIPHEAGNVVPCFLTTDIVYLTIIIVVPHATDVADEA